MKLPWNCSAEQNVYAKIILGIQGHLLIETTNERVNSRNTIFSATCLSNGSDQAGFQKL